MLIDFVLQSNFEDMEARQVIVQCKAPSGSNETDAEHYIGIDIEAVVNQYFPSIDNDTQLLSM